MNEECLEIQHAHTFCLGVQATLSLTGEQGAHTLFTGQRERKREGERVRKRKEREKEKEGGERETEKEGGREMYNIFERNDRWHLLVI